MSKTMKAAVVRAFGEPLRIEEVPVPEVQPGMIQVAIQASGVCHTDLHAAEGDNMSLFLVEADIVHALEELL